MRTRTDAAGQRRTSARYRAALWGAVATAALLAGGCEDKEPGPDPDLTHDLTVQVIGPGTVTSSPAGIDCGADCTEAYAAGTVVTLSAVADSDSTFVGWSGAGCSGTGTCALTLDASAAVTASFAGESERIVVTFDELAGDVMNPERGWIDWIDIANNRDFSATRAAGKTVSFARVYLPQDTDSLAGLLPDLHDGLAAVRAAGTKVFLNFRYHDDYSPDPAASRVIAHVEQLGPLFADNVDVIMLVELGFIGPWGEFHSSHLLDSGEWVLIVDQAFASVPASRMLAFRTPAWKKSYFGRDTPLSDAEAFSGTDVARAGHYNDCFLSNDSDTGTYTDPVADKAFIAQETRFAPMGGETCPDVAGYALRCDCTTAEAELAQLHWTYLNDAWHAPCAGPGGTLDQQGCRGRITERLGYRFVLEEASLTAAVRPGDLLDVSVRLRNDGYASPFNARTVYVVLAGNGETWSAALPGDDADPRRWESGQTTTFSKRLALPAAVSAGSYRVSLWLPDATDSIRDDSRYAIRFANVDTWSDTTGDNLLTDAVQVSASAPPNPGTPDATFTQVP